jgi:non-heme chloroperoxidase
MPFIIVGQENSTDIKIHYEDHGQGEVYVMIHGYPFSGIAWEKEEALFLEKGNRVITYDRRGFGKSSHPSVGYDFNTFAKDLHTLLSQLNLSDVTLIGHSMGSGEITRYLSTYGSRLIKCAVLISPIPPFILKTKDNTTGADQKIFDGFKGEIKKDRYAFVTQFLNGFYNLNDNKTNLSIEKLRADFNLGVSSSPIAFYECVNTWLTDFRKDLPKIDVPLLVIQGDQDKILPIEATGKLIPNFVKADLKVIKNGSHGIPWTHAEEISELVLNFVSNITSERKDDGRMSA